MMCAQSVQVPLLPPYPPSCNQARGRRHRPSTFSTCTASFGKVLAGPYARQHTCKYITQATTATRRSTQRKHRKTTTKTGSQSGFVQEKVFFSIHTELSTVCTVHKARLPWLSLSTRHSNRNTVKSISGVVASRVYTATSTSYTTGSHRTVY
jgi:hypothetical protein